MVSAETAPDLSQYVLNDIPGLSRVSRAFIDIPINRYSTDTFQLMRQAVEQWKLELRRRQVGESAFAPDADITPA
jgi:NTE family protein